MFTKKLMSISIATLATLGAFAISAESASARPGEHGFRGGHDGGFHRGFDGGRHWGHRHWGHGYRWGVYGAPVVLGAAAYVPECYYVRRRGILYKVCD